PHIALLGPKVNRIKTDEGSGLLAYSAEEEADLLLSDTIEEKTSERILPYVTGFRCRLQKLSGPTKIGVKYSFFFRIAPPGFKDSNGLVDEFRRIEISSNILRESLAQVTLKIFNAQGSELYTSSTDFKVKDNMVRVSIPEASFQDCMPYLATSEGNFPIMRRFEAPGGSEKRAKKEEIKYLGTSFAFIPSFSISESLTRLEDRDDWQLVVRL